ncbi:MAG: putative sulfate exporter family transporter [Rhodomicrobium sp.]
MTTRQAWNEASDSGPVQPSRFSDFYLKEDWWAIWLGLGIVVLDIVLFNNGSTLLKTLAINPGGIKWHSFDELLAHFSANASTYLLQFIAWLVIFGVSCRVMGIKLLHFIPGFAIVYAVSLVMFGISGWANASQYNLEAALLALLFGLIVANLFGLPSWMDGALRVEYFIKLGIVLLGATFPLTLVVTAGPVALGQATVISLLTCLTIFFAGTKLFGLDKRLCAVLGVGGAVCGVSASLAISASVGAKKEHLYTSVTIVVVWALIMVFALPFVSQALGLPAGVAGAWIGTSEFADAAGFAAATAYGKISGNEDAAIKAFTLMKVIGRDLWIGIWSLVFAFIATTVWDRSELGTRPGAGEIWRRFPKFVIGFFIASAIVTLVTNGYSAEEIGKKVKPDLLKPIASLRSWAFLFCFLSIGLTTRFRELKSAGLKPFLAFTLGVVVNVAVGYFLSVHVFGDYWGKL